MKNHEVLVRDYKLLLNDDINLPHQSWNIYAATAAALYSNCEFCISDDDLISHSTKKTPNLFPDISDTNGNKKSPVTAPKSPKCG